MGLNLNPTSGQTPIDEEEKDGLLIPTISSRMELDEFEQQNIEEAIHWIVGRRLKAETILTEKFICNLHRRMYGNVWSWAGAYRKTNKNLGMESWQIPTALRTLCDNALYWVMHTTYPSEEMAIRFKHQLVSIHCFANGNGRHSRLMADVIIEKIYRQPVFSWGAAGINSSQDARILYLQAVKEADRNNFESLVTFARS